MGGLKSAEIGELFLGIKIPQNVQRLFIKSSPDPVFLNDNVRRIYSPEEARLSEAEQYTDVESGRVFKLIRSGETKKNNRDNEVLDDMGNVVSKTEFRQDKFGRRVTSYDNQGNMTAMVVDNDNRTLRLIKTQINPTENDSGARIDKDHPFHSVVLFDLDGNTATPVRRLTDYVDVESGNRVEIKETFGVPNDNDPWKVWDMQIAVGNGQPETLENYKYDSAAYSAKPTYTGYANNRRSIYAPNFFTNNSPN